MPEDKPDLTILESEDVDYDEIKYAINEIKLTEEDETKLAKIICEEIEKAEGDMGDLPGKKKRWQDLYEGNVQKKTFPWKFCSNLAAASAVVSAMCEGFHNRIIAALFGGNYVWIARALPGADADKAEIAQDFLHYVQSVEMNLKKVLDAPILDLTKYGNMFAILEWNYETQKVRDVERYNTLEELLKANAIPVEYGVIKEGYFDPKIPNTETGMETPSGLQIPIEYKPYIKKLARREPQEIWVEYNRIMENQPKLSFINWDDFFVSGGKDAHEDLMRARIIGHKLRLRWDDLIRRAKVDENGNKTDNPFGIYFNLDKIKEAYSRNDKEKANEEYRKKEYDIRQCLFRYDIDEDGYEEMCVFSIEWNTKTLIRAELYPYWHNRPNYIPWTFFPTETNKLFGIALPGWLENLADEYDKMTNQQIDNNTLANTVQFKGLRGSSAEEEWDRERFYPGVVYWLDNPATELEQLQIAHNPIGTLANKQEIKSLMEMRTGYSQYFSGQIPATDARSPASKTAMLMQEALMKVQNVIERIQQGPLRELAYQIWELYYQYMPDNKPIGVFGTSGRMETITLRRQDLERYNLDFIPIGTSARINKRIDNELNVMLAQVIVTNPLFERIMTNPIAKNEIAETIIRNWEGDWAAKIDKLLPPLRPEEMMTVMPAQQMEGQQGGLPSPIRARQRRTEKAVRPPETPAPITPTGGVG